MSRLYSVLFLSALLCACVVEASETRNIEKVVELEKGQVVRIDISVAELRIEATERQDVGVELTVRCRWHFNDCEDTLEDVAITSRSSSRRMTLELTGLSHWYSSMMAVEGTIEIPRASPLEVKMGVADLDVRGIEQDLRIDVGVGELDIRLPEAKIGEAFVDVGVGTVRFFGGSEHPEKHRSFLVGNEVHWADGAGKSELEIEVGVGEVRVRLE
jgi:hypothetical protein